MVTHASRDTTTGKVNEDDIEQFLIENYSGNVHSQVVVGTQFNTTKKHIVDILLDNTGVITADHTLNIWKIYIKHIA